MKPVVLPECPSSNRYWRHAKGRTYVSKEAENYRLGVSFLWPVGRCPLIPKPSTVRLTIDWYRGAKRGDLTNREKVLCDALNGVAYDDDSQIVELHMRRFEDPKDPRVEVTVEAVG